jgi:hypothetical protein
MKPCWSEMQENHINPSEGHTRLLETENGRSSFHSPPWRAKLIHSQLQIHRVRVHRLVIGVREAAASSRSTNKWFIIH